MDKTALVMKMVNGLASLIDGEGDYETYSVNPGKGDFIDVKVDMPYPEYRDDLLKEIGERLKTWRINPFISIVPKGDDEIRFHHMPIDELMKEYNKAIR